MEKNIRFVSYLQEIEARNTCISYKHLMPKIQKDAQGNDIPYEAPKFRLKKMDIYKVFAPYFGVRMGDQMRAVLPLALYLGLFQYLVLRQSISDSLVITFGLAAVMIGLMFFMEGLKLGLMPFGETIGNNLPRKAKLHTVLIIAFILGVGVTFAEPAIGALKVAGSIVDPRKAPILYAMLNNYSDLFVLAVGAGVGVAAVFGTVRFIYGWSLKPFIYCTLIPAILFSIYTQSDPELRKIIGVAWDCGGITTGPVTVPLLLSLGIGVAAAVGKGSSTLSGFGIVTLASILPVLFVLALGVYVSAVTTPEAIIKGAEAAATAAAASVPGWYDTTPWVEIIMGLRAIVPLILFLMFVLAFILKEKTRNVGILRYGIALAIIGMIIFNLGLTYGLAKLGDQSGGLVPGSFTQIAAMSDSPLYSYAFGILIALLFAWFLGLGATIAEPALNALGMTVENLTSGAFKKMMLIYAVSIGVGLGIALGVAKIIFDFEILYALIGCYIIALIMTYLSSEEFVNVGWDSAGVTTGPVTVPLVLAMGLGFGKAVGAIEGFGILATASVGPIITVLGFGMFVQWQVKRRNKKNKVKDVNITSEEVII